MPKGETGSPGSAFGIPHPAESSSPGPAPASPVPAVPSSRSGTPCRSSRRPRKISCSFSKCSEEAAEVAMAQVARELRPLSLRALGPLPPQQSAAQPRSHHCSRTSASRNQALPGSSEPDALPTACHCTGAGRQSLTGSRGGDDTRLLQGRGLVPRPAGVSDLETVGTGEVPKGRAQGSPRDWRLGSLIQACRFCIACWEL